MTDIEAIIYMIRSTGLVLIMMIGLTSMVVIYTEGMYADEVIEAVTEVCND